jgi:hypothetical protein
MPKTMALMTASSATAGGMLEMEPTGGLGMGWRNWRA